MDEDRTFDEFLNEYLNSESKQYREEFKKELLKLDITDKEAANGQNKESENTLEKFVAIYNQLDPERKILVEKRIKEEYIEQLKNEE